MKNIKIEAQKQNIEIYPKNKYLVILSIGIIFIFFNITY